MSTLIPTPRQVPAVDRVGGVDVPTGCQPATGVVYETFTSPFAD